MTTNFEAQKDALTFLGNMAGEADMTLGNSLDDAMQDGACELVFAETLCLQ